MSSLPAFDTNTFDTPAVSGEEPEWAGLRFEGDRVTAAGGGVASLELGPKGFYGLSHAEGSRLVRLASAMDPAAEDRALVERFAPDPERGVLCVGLGLGCHLEELARRLAPEAPLWVLESRPELAGCALAHRDLSALFTRPGFRLFIGPFTERPWGDETPPPQVLWRPSTARHFAAEYPGVPVPARPAARPRLARRLLVFQSGYFLDRELANAARELGLETAAWRFERGLEADGDNFRDLLGLIKNFRPELVLTVNHLGFDAEGIMDDLFTRLKLPVASWFVDSPAFILGDNRPSPYVAAFSWDRDYLPFLRGRGFARVRHLPLATDESFFHPRSAPLTPAHTLAFVGDSLTAATDKALGKLGLDPAEARVPEILAAADRLAGEFLGRPDLWPASETLTDLAGLANTPAEKLLDLAALVTWRASRLKRLEVLRALPWPRLTVAGDRHWGPLLGLDAGRLIPALDYYTELAPFYQASRVNLNITSAQMKTGLNQRVFDVPAAGAFLLTDHQEQLADLFEPGREVVTYRDPAEARHLALWYADRPEARESVIRAAGRRIHNEHLYRHRLAALLAAME